MNDKQLTIYDIKRLTKISAPSGNYETVRIFNPINNQLENE